MGEFWETVWGAAWVFLVGICIAALILFLVGCAPAQPADFLPCDVKTCP